VFQYGDAQGIYTFADSGSPKFGQLVSAANPAHVGEYLTWWGTGLGQKRVAPSQDGMPVLVANWAIASVTMTVGGKPAQVLYAGSAPCCVGLDQINFVVPDGVGLGSQLVGVTAAETAAATPTYITIAAK
jgi:uncharacterized protein (TIGR03437 family)